MTSSEITADVQARIAEFEKLCIKRGIRITNHRRLIFLVLITSTDHPDVETVYRRAIETDATLSIATVYRTIRLLEEEGILDRHDFGYGRARYELVPDAHHDHLIDIETGQIIEFVDPELEMLQKEIAKRLGYRLVDHRLELYVQRA